MKGIVYVLCALTFLMMVSSCCTDCDDKELIKPAIDGEGTGTDTDRNNGNVGNEVEETMTMTPEEYTEKILVSLANNENLEIRDLSSFETNPDLVAFPDRDVVIDQNGVLSLGLAFVDGDSQVNGIGFSIGDDPRAYVVFPTLQVGEPLNTLSVDVELGLDNCEFIRDLCDIIPIRFFAIKTDGTVSVSFTDHIRFSCPECPLTFRNTAWANLYTDSVTNTFEEYFSNHEQRRSFVITGQDEFVRTQQIDYPNWGLPGYMPYEEEILPTNQFNTIQCYKQGSFHVIRVKKGNLLILFYAPVGGLENYITGVNSNSDIFVLTGAGTKVGSLIKGPTVMVYELDKPPGSNWWLMYDEDMPDTWFGEFVWWVSDEDIIYPRPYHDPFKAKHHLHLYGDLIEHRPFLEPRTYSSSSGNVEYKRDAELYLNVYLTCRHM